MEHLDIVIIGAGWHGLAMAKTYLEVCPEANMWIIDSAASVGGTWAKERLYPGLKTNNLVGSYEFSDFPMDFDRFNIRPEQHIPGETVHEYLTQFAEHFDLTSRLRLRRRVEAVELRKNGDWLLRIVSEVGGEAVSTVIEVTSKKLVVATGLTSEPFVPKFRGQESFNREFFHAKELRKRADVIRKAKEVVVLGGNKSAWDTCFFAAAEAGAHVHMVMRPSGGGPSWLWPKFFSPLKLSVQRIAQTRLFNWFDPCIWAERTGPIGYVRRLLHNTAAGRYAVDKFWHTLRYFAQQTHRYDDHPETQKLKPWVSPFWMGNSLSVHNYTLPWFELVREGKITVHVADIDHLSEGTVHLSNDVSLKVDALVSCTGWEIMPPIKLQPEGLSAQLGLEEDRCKNSGLIQRAQSEIFAKFPALQKPLQRSLPLGVMPPKTGYVSSEKQISSRYQLYRFVVPSDPIMLAQRNIAFIGAHLALTAIPVAQMQALWITAFFQNAIPHLRTDNIDIHQVRYDTILHSEYSRIRHPHEAGGAGNRCPDLTFDCLPYMELLGHDLGLAKYRKSSPWSEIFHRYTPKDFRGIVQDWLALRQRSTR